MEPVKADYIAMLESAEGIWRLTVKLEEEISKLKAVLNDIDIFWQGEANSAFHLALNEDFLIMEALCLKFKYSANLIRRAVEEYSAGDSIVSCIVGGL